MSFSDIFQHTSTLVLIVAAAAVLLASFKTNTAKVWKDEAEAQTARADRLERSLDEINAKLSRIEKENARLLDLLTSLDPTRLAVIRLASTPMDGD